MIKRDTQMCRKWKVLQSVGVGGGVSLHSVCLPVPPPPPPPPHAIYLGRDGGGGGGSGISPTSITPDMCETQPNHCKISPQLLF